MAISGLIKDLIRSNKLNYHEGKLEILDIPGIVLPAPTYTLLLENVSEQSEIDVLNLLFDVGREHGKIGVQELGRENSTTPTQFIEHVTRTANVMGTGKIEVERYDPNEKILTISITDSPLNSFFKDSETLNPDKPIHQFWHGVMHQVSREIFDSEIKSQEKKCQYLGDEKCIIECRAVE